MICFDTSATFTSSITCWGAATDSMLITRVSMPVTLPTRPPDDAALDCCRCESVFCM